ncbi:MAG: hypothetical protein K6G03_01940, partial [Lachnospiraceae bacterium]|nr:hypothetical protein [Lachnospiraceae bacterium]
KSEVYDVRIHINGDWHIGRFPTHEMAVIAYNKAIDLAKKAGLKKRTETLDMPEGLSHALYARIYSSIEIPEKYCDYLLHYNDSNDHL